MLVLLAIAFVAELIDSSLGMMYGTLLTPVMIASGFEPLVVIPAVLFSQSLGGIVASFFHHRFCNADFGLQAGASPRQMESSVAALKNRLTKDIKVVLIISSFGVIATVIGALTALNLPKWLLRGYIGALVAVMGIIVIVEVKWNFSWGKITAVGLLSAFNKGISGGGFGPLVTSGQIIAGNEPRSSVAATTLAEAPICIAGFLTYLIAGKGISWVVIIPLSLGAVAAAPLGAYLTSKLRGKFLKKSVGALSLILGLFMLLTSVPA
ncbi:MAG: hypothetical protein Kow0090_14150 [Myxococcota bacterium]